MEHFNIKFEPDGKNILIHKGSTILEAASRVGIILNTPCGGKGICKKCRVQLKTDNKLVCACQHHIESNLSVIIPPNTRFLEHKILSDGLDTELQLQPDIYTQYLKNAPDKKVLGLALDIGTTTVVAKLIDMTTGKTLAGRAVLNPQTKLGDNVISRISYADTNRKLDQLNDLIIDCINQMIKELCSQTRFDKKSIFEICAVGNTTMNHIFLKLPVAQLGHAPYQPALLDSSDNKPQKIALNINNTGNIHTPPNIAGFVGSDIIAVAVAVDIENIDENTLVIDIGTNSELLLSTGSKIYAASCAAGPALEGAGISCGSRAAQGAIEAVFVNNDDDNDIDFDVIGNCPPKSICGSGLIDAAAVLTQLKVIDSSGRFLDPQNLSHLSKSIFSRIIQINGQPAFMIAEDHENKVFISQKDIRQIQLAKAAIRTGIELLLQKLGIKQRDIKQIYLAGA
ncbi:MAG: ASKHA domain-containing protein, partial [Planctomycetota bacterium]